MPTARANHITAELGATGFTTQLTCDCPRLFRNHFNEEFEGAFQHRHQKGDKDLLHLNDPIEVVISDAKTRPHPRYRGLTLPCSHRWINRYSPPEYMVRRYDPDNRGVPMIHPDYGLADDWTPEELHNLWAHYAAEAELVVPYQGRSFAGALANGKGRHRDFAVAGCFVAPKGPVVPRRATTPFVVGRHRRQPHQGLLDSVNSR